MSDRDVCQIFGVTYAMNGALDACEQKLIAIACELEQLSEGAQAVGSHVTVMLACEKLEEIEEALTEQELAILKSVYDCGCPCNSCVRNREPFELDKVRHAYDADFAATVHRIALTVAGLRLHLEGTRTLSEYFSGRESYRFSLNIERQSRRLKTLVNRSVVVRKRDLLAVLETAGVGT